MIQKGKLFLASRAAVPESMEKLEKFAGGLKGKSVVYCPTAANGERGYGSWKDSETLKIVKKSVAKVTIVELENYWNEDVLNKFRNKDIVWFAGGMSGYLMYWIRRVALDILLPKLLSKGVIYVGSSAGSMICAPTHHLAELFHGEEERGASVIPGLGFIDFEIFPHYDEKYLPALKEKWHYGKLCLLKDGEAITISDGKMEILGEERFITEL